MASMDEQQRGVQHTSADDDYIAKRGLTDMGVYSAGRKTLVSKLPHAPQRIRV